MFHFISKFRKYNMILYFLGKLIPKMILLKQNFKENNNEIIMGNNNG